MREQDGAGGVTRSSDDERGKGPEICRDHAAITPRDAAPPFDSFVARVLRMGALVPVRLLQDEAGKFNYPSPVKWGQDAPPSEQDWQDNWASWQPVPGKQGVAIHLGKANLMLIDLDRKNGHDGIAAYESAFGTLPQTYTEATPTSGLHLLCHAHPALLGLEKNQDTGILDGVDVKWGNQIAVCAPTVRPDGEYLRLDEGCEIVMPPQALVDLVVARLSSPAGGQAARPIADILAHGSDRGSRDMDVTRLVWYFSHLHGSGEFGRAEIMRQAQEWNRDHCRPPLSEQVVARKVERVLAGHKAPSGWMVVMSASDPWESTYVATKMGDKSVGVRMTVRRGSGGLVTHLDATAVSFFAAGEWRHLGSQMNLRVDSSYYRFRQAESLLRDLELQIGLPPIKPAEMIQVIQGVMQMMEQDSGPRDVEVGAMDVLAADLPPEEWLVEGLIQRGVINILVGNGDTGKTTLGLAMCAAVASGMEWSEDDIIVPNAKLPVFYYTAEDDWQNLAPRLKMLAMGRDISNMKICDGITDDTSLFHRIRKVEAGVGECFRVIDSASAIFDGLNDNSQVVSFMRGLRLLGGSTMIDAHISKAGLAGGRNDPMGAIQWRNQARNILSIAYDPDDRTILNMVTEKHNGGLMVGLDMQQSIKRHVERNKTMWYGPALGRTTRSLLCAGVAAGHRQTRDLYAWAENEHGVARSTARKERSRLAESGRLVEVQGLLYLRHEADAMQLLGSE